MIAICNGTDMTPYMTQGYTYEREPQIIASMTALDGTDHSVKIRDRVKLTVPLIPLTMEQLTRVLRLFPDTGAYVEWTYYDPHAAGTRVIQAKYETRTSRLKRVYRDGTEYYEGLVIKLIER